MYPDFHSLSNVNVICGLSVLILYSALSEDIWSEDIWRRYLFVFQWQIRSNVTYFSFLFLARSHSSPIDQGIQNLAKSLQKAQIELENIWMVINSTARRTSNLGSKVNISQ